jgi:hypothetical protein
MLKDTVNTRLAGMLSITSESGGRPSIDIFRRIVFGNLEIMPCRFTYLCVKEPTHMKTTIELRPIPVSIIHRRRWWMLVINPLVP